MNRQQLRKWYVILASVLCAAAMAVIDGVIRPPYAVKSAIKLALFLLVPLGYFAVFREAAVQLRRLFIPDRKALRQALLLGAGVFAVILGAYFLLRRFIDFSLLAQSLTANAGVGADNFVFVALYISFINSLLEEFFFRGFAFLTLKGLTPRGFSYVFSAALFALYHVGMTSGWFSPAIWALALAGLFLGGCIFNRLNEKSGSIITSWLVHMCANFAINTVGFMMFGLI